MNKNKCYNQPLSPKDLGRVSRSTENVVKRLEKYFWKHDVSSLNNDVYDESLFEKYNLIHFL